jgi:hypothetical protein
MDGLIPLKYIIGGVVVMSESEEGQMTEEDILGVAADRLVWIRLLEKAVNDIDGVLRGLKNDIAEISMAMQSRGTTDEEETAEEESDENE